MTQQTTPETKPRLFKDHSKESTVSRGHEGRIRRLEAKIDSVVEVLKAIGLLKDFKKEDTVRGEHEDRISQLESTVDSVTQALKTFRRAQIMAAAAVENALGRSDG